MRAQVLLAFLGREKITKFIFDICEKQHRKKFDFEFDVRPLCNKKACFILWQIYFLCNVYNY